MDINHLVNYVIYFGIVRIIISVFVVIATVRMDRSYKYD